MWRQNDKNHGFWECSKCHHEAYWDSEYGQQLFDYCPYCGCSDRRHSYLQKTDKLPQFIMEEFKGDNE